MVILESAGAGQGEKGLFYMCDTVVALFTPEYGDEFQLLKAGLMEISDIIVVNKADKPGAADAEREIETYSRDAVRWDGWVVPVLLTRADRGDGMDALADAIERHWHSIGENGRRDTARKEKAEFFLMNLLKEELWQRFSEKLKGSTFCAGLIDEACSGRADPYTTALRILDSMELREGD
jgi:LAO/AO transport system kinase